MPAFGQPSRPEKTNLLDAIKKGDQGRDSQALRNSEDTQAETPKPVAASRVPSFLMKAVAGGKVEVVQEWLAKGADANEVVGGYGNSLLMIAAGSSHSAAPEILRLLAASGADIHSRNALQETALHQASRRQKGGGEIVSTLLDLGADLEARDEEGWTPLLRSLEFGGLEILQVLLEAGANTGVFSPDGSTARDTLRKAAETYEPVEDRRLALEAALDQAGTPLHLPQATKSR